MVCVGIYVEDLAIAGTQQAIMDAYCASLIKHFEIQNKEEADYLLGINIQQSNGKFIRRQARNTCKTRVAHLAYSASHRWTTRSAYTSAYCMDAVHIHTHNACIRRDPASKTAQALQMVQYIAILSSTHGLHAAYTHVAHISTHVVHVRAANHAMQTRPRSYAVVPVCCLNLVSSAPHALACLTPPPPPPPEPQVFRLLLVPKLSSSPPPLISCRGRRRRRRRRAT
eukprot:6176477-Pleurochrysis_carterae.AAC.1